MVNTFEALEVEDAEEFYDSIAVVPTPRKKSNKAAPLPVPTLYESTIGVDSDVAFGVYCFFEDMHKIQEHVKNVWNLYKESKVDLISATFIATAAIELVRAAEDDIMKNLPSHMRVSDSFEAMVSIIYGTEELKPRVSYAASKIPHGSKLFDQFVYQNTGRTLAHWLKAVKSRKTEELALAPIPSLLRTDARFANLIRTPEIKKAERDENFLIQLCMDTLFWIKDLKDCVEDKRNDPVRLHDDIFTKSQKILMEQGAVRAWIVFAAQVMIDINDTLGSLQDLPLKDLQAAGKQADQSLALDPDDRFCNKCGGCGNAGSRWGHANKHIPEAAYNLLHDWILPSGSFLHIWFNVRQSMLRVQRSIHQGQLVRADVISRAVHREKSQAMRAVFPCTGNEEFTPSFHRVDVSQSLDDINPNSELEFFFRANPLWSGHTKLQLAVKMEAASVALANYRQPILSLAHLYNALQQYGLLEESWPELEKCMEVQKMALFGSMVPTEPKEMYNRMLTRMGYAPAHFACSGSRTCQCIPKLRKDKKVYDFQGDPTMKIFRSMLMNELSLEQSLYRIDSLMVPAAKKRQTCNLTPLYFLSRLGTWMPQLVARLEKVDYIALAKEGNNLLATVSIMIDTTIDDPYRGTVSISLDEHGPTNAFMVSNILWNGMTDERFQRQKAAKDPPFDGKALIRCAADVVNTYLTTKSWRRF